MFRGLRNPSPATGDRSALEGAFNIIFIEFQFVVSLSLWNLSYLAPIANIWFSGMLSAHLLTGALPIVHQAS